MTPKLPPNPWTISYVKADLLDVAWLNDRYWRDHEKLVLIENQLNLLRCWDNYDRQTDPEREAVKEILLSAKRKLTP